MTPRVLFVCSGSTCRSPLAEALARRAIAAEGWDAVAESAGVSAVDGAPASAGSVAVAREADLDLAAHRARLLTRPMVLEADLVLTMGARHRDFIRVLAPEAVGRVHVLRAYATRGAESGDVRDPFGGDLDAYRRTVEELGELVERALGRWVAERD